MNAIDVSATAPPSAGGPRLARSLCPAHGLIAMHGRTKPRPGPYWPGARPSPPHGPQPPANVRHLRGLERGEIIEQESNLCSCDHPAAAYGSPARPLAGASRSSRPRPRGYMEPYTARPSRWSHGTSACSRELQSTRPAAAAPRSISSASNSKASGSVPSLSLNTTSENTRSQAQNGHSLFSSCCLSTVYKHALD